MDTQRIRDTIKEAADNCKDVELLELVRILLLREQATMGG